MKTGTNSLVNEKKREWIKTLLATSEDEKAREAFQVFQSEIRERLYEYSFSNFFWLAMQSIERGDYSLMFGSFNKWKSLKRFVRKGEKAMAVLVPCTIVRKDDAGNPIIENGKPKTFTYFNVRNGVFSIAQTDANDGSPLPSFRTISNFSDVMFDKLFESVSKTIPVESKPLSVECGGYTDGQKIVLNSMRDKASQFVTLVHELSHVMLEHATDEIRSKLNKDDRETEAELSTLIYCTMSGIESKGSATYLQGYMDIETVDIARINRAIKSAGKIHALLHPKKEKEVAVA